MRRGLICLMLGAAACATPRTHRTGEPLVLAGDPAVTPCEHAAWVQLAPTHVGAQAAETVAVTNTYIAYSTHDLSADGVAAYGKDLTLRLSSEQTAKLIGNPMLRPDIDANMRSILGKKSTANGFMVGGFVATGIGGALALSDLENPTAGLVIMGVGLAAEIVALLVRPHNADVAWAEVRERIFVDGETDMEALSNGVAQANQQARERCR